MKITQLKGLEANRVRDFYRRFPVLSQRLGLLSRGHFVLPCFAQQSRYSAIALNPRNLDSRNISFSFFFKSMMDKSIFGDSDSLSGEDKEKMSAMIDQLQTRDSLRMYNSLVEGCFVDCVDKFYRRSLTKKEETCVRRSAEKFLRHSVLLGLSFAEHNQVATTTD